MTTRLLIRSILFFSAFTLFCESVSAEKKEGTFLDDILNFPFESAQGFEKTLETYIFNLGEVLVSTGRISSEFADETATNLPHNITLIGPREIKENSSFSLPEILHQKEGVTLSDETGLGLNARLDLRGFGGEAKQALVLFDGIRAVEPFDNSMVWHLYPKEFIRQVEIRRGGGSTINGEGALSGVIRLKTKDPTEQIKITGDASWGDFKLQKYFVDASGKVGNIGIYTGAYYAQTDGYRNNSDHEAVSFLIKSELPITNLIVLKNNFYFADHETGIPGPLSQAEVDANRRQQDPDGQPGDQFADKLIQNGLTLNYRIERLGIELSDLLGYRLRQQNSTQSFGGFFGGTSISDIETETFSNVLQGSWITEGESFRSNLITGAEWSKDDIGNPFEFTSFAFGPFSAERSVDRQMIGAFLQVHLTIRDRLILESGLRWDKIDWEIYDLRMPHLQKRKKAKHTSPKLGVEFKFSDALSIYTSYSDAFKVPDANTLIFETPNLFTPNPDIDPQIARHTEIGLRYAHPLIGSVRTDIFYVETKKEILFNDITNLNENFDTKRQGIELAAELALNERAQVFANLTYTKAEFDNGAFDGKTIPLVPESKWSAGVLLKPLKHLMVSVQATGVYDQFALNDFNNIFPMNDYWILGGKVAYQKENWEFYLRVQNILGEEYSSFVTSNAVDTVNHNPAPTSSIEAGFRFEI